MSIKWNAIILFLVRTQIGREKTSRLVAVKVWLLSSNWTHSRCSTVPKMISGSLFWHLTLWRYLERNLCTMMGGCQIESWKLPNFSFIFTHKLTVSLFCNSKNSILSRENIDLLSFSAVYLILKITNC